MEKICHVVFSEASWIICLGSQVLRKFPSNFYWWKIEFASISSYLTSESVFFPYFSVWINFTRKKIGKKGIETRKKTSRWKERVNTYFFISGICPKISKIELNNCRTFCKHNFQQIHYTSLTMTNPVKNPKVLIGRTLYPKHTLYMPATNDTVLTEELLWVPFSLPFLVLSKPFQG